MGCVLIAMPRQEDAMRIAVAIRESGVALDVEICMTGAEILRKMHDRDFGVVICTKKLNDMSYADLSGYLTKYFGMIVVTRDVSLESVGENMVKLMLPFKKRELISTVEMIVNDFYSMIRKKKKTPPKRSDSERKVIDRAKAMLMDQNGMSEPEAFRYIQKNSMDNGRSMVESAQMLLILGGG